MPITRLDRRSRRRSGGFSLVEVMVASTLSALVMAAVLSSFLMLGRSEANAAHYVTMEGDARKALERFGEDVRMAQYLTTVSTAQIKLTIPHASDNSSDTVFYTYDASAKTFTRLGPDPVTNVANTSTILISDVERCEFKRWMIGGTGPATSDASTDQLQIRISVRKSSVTAVAATNLVVSARYVLRNHRSGTVF
jgi:prepilin-type N-terminal cleavage/methylation domain-containing protein